VEIITSIGSGQTFLLNYQHAVCVCVCARACVRVQDHTCLMHVRGGGVRGECNRSLSVAHARACARAHTHTHEQVKH